MAFGEERVQREGEGAFERVELAIVDVQEVPGEHGESREGADMVQPDEMLAGGRFHEVGWVMRLITSLRAFSSISK